jgi:hypothetical protein
MVGRRFNRICHCGSVASRGKYTAVATYVCNTTTRRPTNIHTRATRVVGEMVDKDFRG